MTPQTEAGRALLEPRKRDILVSILVQAGHNEGAAEQLVTGVEREAGAAAIARVRANALTRIHEYDIQDRIAPLWLVLAILDAEARQ